MRLVEQTAGNTATPWQQTRHGNLDAADLQSRKARAWYTRRWHWCHAQCTVGLHNLNAMVLDLSTTAGTRPPQLRLRCLPTVSLRGGSIYSMLACVVHRRAAQTSFLVHYINLPVKKASAWVWRLRYNYNFLQDHFYEKTCWISAHICKTDDNTERQLMHKRAHAIVFIVLICYLLVVGAGNIRLFLLEPARLTLSESLKLGRPGTKLCLGRSCTLEALYIQVVCSCDEQDNKRY